MKPIQGIDTKAIQGLNNTIGGLREDVKELFKYKEMWRESQVLIEQLSKQLKIKRDVSRVVVKRDGIPYIVRLNKVTDTKEGIIIEGEL